MTALSLDHVCLEVEEIEASEVLWQNILGLESRGITTLDLGKGSGFVKTVFFKLERGSIELSQHRLDGDWRRSPLMKGPGFHHVSFQVESLNDVLDELSRKGYESIPHFPRDTPHGRVAFLDPAQSHGILIELKENT